LCRSNSAAATAAAAAAAQVPSVDSNYHAELFSGSWRDDIKPLNVVQPEVCWGWLAPQWGNGAVQLILGW